MVWLSLKLIVVSNHASASGKYKYLREIDVVMNMESMSTAATAYNQQKETRSSICSGGFFWKKKKWLMSSDRLAAKCYDRISCLNHFQLSEDLWHPTYAFKKKKKKKTRQQMKSQKLYKMSPEKVELDAHSQVAVG